MQPGIVGISGRWATVDPARIAFQATVPPVADIEWRVSQNEVGTQVAVLVANKGVRRFTTEVEIDTTDR
ncbi:hypothetical protein D9M69_722600 [compost metagenome]